MPFDKAAEIGTRKVIAEHSTIGLVITTNGSISDIPRDEYEEAEGRVISRLQELNKPFIVLLNCMYPHAAPAKELSVKLSEKYGVPVLPINCLELTETEIKEDDKAQLLFEFPIREVSVKLPFWLTALPHDHWLRKALFGAVASAANEMELVRDVSLMTERLKECEYTTNCSIHRHGSGVRQRKYFGTRRVGAFLQGSFRINRSYRGKRAKSYGHNAQARFGKEGIRQAEVRA